MKKKIRKVLSYISLQYKRHTVEANMLFLLLAVGSVVRIILMPSTEWSGDVARDLLVSQHMLLYHEIPNIGHVASGTNPIFYYPPIYYWLLTVIQLVSTNIWYVLSVFVFFSVMSIVTFYFVARRLTNRFCAYIATLLYTFSPFYMGRQTTISSMHFTLPILLLGTLFHLVGIQTKNKTYIFASLFFLIVASSINYAALILLPVYGLWIIIYFRNSFKDLLYFFIYSYFLVFILFAPFTIYVASNYGWGTFFGPFYASNNVSLHANIVGQIIDRYGVFLSNIFPEYTTLYMYLIPFLVFFAIARKVNMLSYLYPLSFISITLFLAAIKNMPVGSYYYYLVNPFVFILVVSCFNDKVRLSMQWVITMVVFGVYLISNQNALTVLLYRENTYAQTEAVADEVLQYMRQAHPDSIKNADINFQLTALNAENNDWEGLKYSYFLEKKVTKVFRIYDHYNNLQWIAPNDYIVMLCMVDDSTDPNWCTENFTRIYPKYRLVSKLPADYIYPIHIFQKINASSL